MADKIARAALEILQQGTVKLPLELGKNLRVAVLWPNLREVRDRFTFEGGPEQPLRALRQRLAPWPARISFLKTPILKTEGIDKILNKARGADLTVFFCFEAMRFEGQKKILETLQSAVADRLVVCLLRNPWDKELLKSNVTALHAYGYRDCQFKALVEALHKT